MFVAEAASTLPSRSSGRPRWVHIAMSFPELRIPIRALVRSIAAAPTRVSPAIGRSPADTKVRDERARIESRCSYCRDANEQLHQ